MKPTNPCSFCDAKCCKTYTITVTAFDVLRISEKTGRKPEDFAILHPLRILSYDPDQVLDTTDGCGYYLLGLKSHPCVFLGKDNLCTIHEHAPMSCRRYPYQVNDKLNTRFCPLPSQILFRLKGPDMKATPLLLELEAHKKIVKEWNAKKGRMADCLPFLLERARLAAEEGRV
ncbi:MAG TPA: YkgJ family cysteine cluster protein [Candidatus Bilamarchaeum sp.]|nr:YkgJ family cysteine cluster protein [Candidatus Bilamarchaeum sp.]